MDNQQNGQAVFSCVCEKCGRTLYEGEMLNINGKFVCEPCADRCVFGDFSSAPRKRRKAVSPFFNFIFSLHPGAGQMFQGFMKRGLFQMCIFYGCIFLCSTGMPAIFGLLIPIICIYSFFDSLSLRRRVADGEDVNDELGGISEFLGRNKGIIIVALIIMILCGFVSSAFSIFRQNMYTRQAERQIANSVEVIVENAAEEAANNAARAYSYTRVYTPFPFFSTFIFGSWPLLLILIGGVIIIKSGKRGRRDKGGARSEYGEYDKHGNPGNTGRPSPSEDVYDMYDSKEK